MIVGSVIVAEIGKKSTVNAIVTNYFEWMLFKHTETKLFVAASGREIYFLNADCDTAY